jgi:hypothetical protein
MEERGNSGPLLTLSNLVSGFCEDVYYLVDISDGGTKPVCRIICQAIELLQQGWNIGVVWLVSHDGGGQMRSGTSVSGRYRKGWFAVEISRYSVRETLLEIGC